MAKDLPISDGDYKSKGIGGEQAQRFLRKKREKALPKPKTKTKKSNK